MACASEGDDTSQDEDLDVLKAIEDMNINTTCEDPLQIGNMEGDPDCLIVDNILARDDCTPPTPPAILDKILLPEDSIMDVLEQIEGNEQQPVSESMILGFTTGNDTSECTETNCVSSPVCDKLVDELPPSSESVEVLEPIDDMNLFLDVANSMDEIPVKERNTIPESMSDVLKCSEDIDMVAIDNLDDSVHVSDNRFQSSEPVFVDVEMEVSSDSLKAHDPSCSEVSDNGTDIRSEQVTGIAESTDPLGTLPTVEERLSLAIKAVNEEKRMKRSKNPRRGKSSYVAFTERYSLTSYSFSHMYFSVFLQVFLDILHGIFFFFLSCLLICHSSV